MKMSTIKVILRQHEEELVRYIYRKNKERENGGKTTRHTIMKIKEETAFVDGMFSALRQTISKREYQSLCDWDYNLIEELYKMYGIEK